MKLLTSLCCIVTMILLFTSQALGMTVTFTCDANTEGDLAGYRMYMSEQHGGPYTLAGEFAYGPNVEPLMVVPELQNNKRLYFVATAFDTEGLESEYSNEVNVASTDNRPPASPVLRIFRWILSLFRGLQVVDFEPDRG